MQQISNFIGIPYTNYTSDFTEGLEFVDPIESVPPDPGNQVEFELWKIDTNKFWMKTKEYSNFQAGLYS